LHQKKEKTNPPNVFEVQNINSFMYEIEMWKVQRLQKTLFHSIQNKFQSIEFILIKQGETKLV
jgi:anaerobic ribonucleoside-triphosphate reductase